MFYRFYNRNNSTYKHINVFSLKIFLRKTWKKHNYILIFLQTFLKNASKEDVI